ncbi:beta-amylase [Haematococcus lacustris]
MKLLGVSGISVDVFWGAVEGSGPEQYQWSGYSQLLRIIADMGFKIKVNLCMCACELVPLPAWVREVGRANPDIWYTDKQGARNEECLSLGVDEVPVLLGRTALEVYQDFMTSFCHEFSAWLGSPITELLIGLGPNAELRYPSHPAGRWEYPGTGEFQCYDRFMLSTLRACAEQKQPPWGRGGPHDACRYKDWPHQSGFFSANGSWTSPYGKFFLQWYSEMLARHASLVMGAANEVFGDFPVLLNARIPGCHWWHSTQSRAAELTTGYYNTAQREGYLPILGVLTHHGAGVHLSMAEARAVDRPASHHSDPEGLLLAQRTVAAALHMPVTLENSDVRFDEAALARMEAVLFEPAIHLGIEVPQVQALVVNRMTDAMFEPYNWQRFKGFVRKVRDRADLVGGATASMDQHTARFMALRSNT